MRIEEIKVIYIKEGEYQKIKKILNKKDNYFNEEELHIVYKNIIIK